MLKDFDSNLILKSVPNLYLILDTSLTILEASDAYLEATMVKREAIVGRKLFEVFPDNPNDPNATGTRNLNCSIQNALKTKKPHIMKDQKYDIRRPLSEGGGFEERFWRPLNTPVLDEHHNVKYIIHRVEDVTELHRLKNLEVESAQRLQLLIENIKDYAIIMLDSNKKVLTWNTGAERIIGYKEEEVISRPIARVFPTVSYKEEFQIARKDGRFEGEGWRERKNGSRFWAKVIVTPIYGMRSQLIGYGKVISDLTDRKEIEVAKDEFISVVNHELRTPLTSIYGAIKLLLNSTTQSQNKNNELLKTASANCERLLKLITDILDVEKLTTGGIKLHIQDIELNKLIADTIIMNGIYAEEYGVNLTSSLSSSDIIVKIDPDRLIQVLTNLISNAIKFSKPGGEVNVSLTKKKNLVRVAVTNIGEGIPYQFKDKIFKKFSQADASTTRSKSGTGLGLAISKAIMEKLGCTIKFKSIPNKKTIFYFDLPVA
jgi:PAS domain S-box-containing protein